LVLRSKTIRLAVFIGTLIVAAIIIFQLIWLRTIYYYEQKEFNHAIAKAVRGFYEDINDPAHASYNLNELITSPNEQTFFVKFNRKHINSDSLRVLLQSELEDEDVFTDCYAGLYDATANKYDLTVYLPSATAAKNAKVIMPASHEQYDHLTLYFPHRNQYILSRMNFWIISSFILLLLLILLGGSVYYLYRQKFLNETQKDFVNNFTHEFKTPVSVINLAADVLANPATASKPEKLARYAAIVQYQGNYLQDQIERLLQHAYSESNTLHLRKTRLDLHALVNESLNNLHTMIAARGAEISCNFNADDPEVLADKGYMLIVVTNLVENALKYAEHPKIVITTWNTEGALILSIRDNGRGIEKRFRNKIFKKFYRVPNGEQVSSRGFGLGLAFVKKIVTTHRGRIQVESIPGVGSDFRVSLPLN
jgi:two-component system phosphate regulon sensor histidine kinase PhoR